jgi:hypothetical protein
MKKAGLAQPPLRSAYAAPLVFRGTRSSPSSSDPQGKATRGVGVDGIVTTRNRIGEERFREGEIREPSSAWWPRPSSPSAAWKDANGLAIPIRAMRGHDAGALSSAYANLFIELPATASITAKDEYQP